MAKNGEFSYFTIMENEQRKLAMSDLEFVCEMQRKLDAYEAYIMGLFGLVRNQDYIKEGYGQELLLRGTELDDAVNVVFVELIAMIKEKNCEKCED